MPRFLHTADWQIGRQYGRFAEEDAAVLSDARFKTVERLAELAVAEKVDAVLVAGDVFDTQTVSDRTLHRTFQCMSGFAGPWILIPGNHDAALAESIWTRASRINAIPENVHVLLAPETAVFEAAGFAILPAPLTQRQTHQDLTDWFDHAETPAGLVRIGLAHGSVEGQLADVVDSPNPIAENRATSARLDYLALGDWHGCKQINARTWYSGTPEQERFKDNGAGQALIVDIPEPGAEPQVQAHVIGQYPWHSLHHTLAVESDLDELLAALDALPADSVVDLTIDGQLDLAGHQRLRQALAAAEGRHRSLQYHLSGLDLQPTEEDIAALHADGYVGDVISDLRDLQAAPGDDQQTARDALAILAGFLQTQTRQEEAQ
ncbi:MULTISPECIES: DNA repair exonuclease [unclassified Microbulbifer]|uniref:metallophosphoesterase family protein n=1 Tax=unclassified Microbulbifer TaxID=2619833 RepID=UPI0027E58427|nr:MULTISPECIES: DNA repair exonuclease [unclassified Microbulbifer]